MRKRFGRAAAGAAAVAAGAVFAPAAAPAQTLGEALAQAYTTNPRLLSERAALRAADEDVAVALAGWRPVIEAKSSIGHRRLKQDTTFSFPTPDDESMEADDAAEESSGSSSSWNGTDPATVELRISQDVYPFGVTVARTKAAEQRVAAARARLLDVEQQVLADAAEAYVIVVRDQSVVELNANNEQVLERQLQATRDRFHVGEVTRTDVSQAEARVADARASSIEAEGNLEISRANYEKVVGAPPERLAFPVIAGFDAPESAAAALERSLGRNPAILSAAALESAARRDIDIARAALLPRVSIDALARRAWDPSPFATLSDTAEIIANVTVPLYQSGEEYARVRRLRDIAAQRRRELDTARRDVREAAARRWEQLQTARARVTAFRASVEANAIALEGVEQEAAVGARTVLDVLDAEQELFEARVNLVRAESQAATATFQLLRVAGLMTAEALGLPTELYDPVAHYEETRGKWFGFGGD